MASSPPPGGRLGRRRQHIRFEHVGYPAFAKLPTGGGDLLNIRVEVTPETEAAAVAIEMRAGSASVHDSFIIHGSGPNGSDRRRAGFTMRHGNAATVQVDVSTHNKPVYYLERTCGWAIGISGRDACIRRPLALKPAATRVSWRRAERYFSVERMAFSALRT